MPDDKNAVNEFLTSLKTPEDPFKEQDPFTPVVEETEVEEVAEEENPLPFHKDPKVQRYIDRQVANALKDVKPQTETQKFSKDTEDEMTDVLTRIIGNDTPERVQAIKDFRKQLGGLEEKGAQRALAQIQEQEREQVAKDQAAQEELDQYFEEIEETYGVDLSSNTSTARKTRTDFLDYVRKIAPKNEEGEVAAFPDLVASYEEFQEKSKRPVPSNAKAKDLAARGMSRSTDASAVKTTGGKSWKDIDKLFNNVS